MVAVKHYTLTLRQILANLATLADAYEKVSAGTSPTGNYFFAVRASDAAASLKAAQKLIDQLPAWISTEEKMPPDNKAVLVNHWITGVEMAYRKNDSWYMCWTNVQVSDYGYDFWMPLPESPNQDW